MAEREELLGVVRDLFREQLLGVLSSHDRGRPYASLVAFASPPDLRGIFFATTRATRKFTFLSADARAAFLVDNRSNAVADFSRAMAVTVLGRTEEILSAERHAALEIYLDKLPHLESFVAAPSCALMRLKVEKYILVTRFQQVREFEP